MYMHTFVLKLLELIWVWANTGFWKTVYSILFIYLVWICAHLCVWLWRSQGITFRINFSPSTMWAMRIESALCHWTISLIQDWKYLKEHDNKRKIASNKWHNSRPWRYFLRELLVMLDDYIERRKGRILKNYLHICIHKSFVCNSKGSELLKIQ